MKGTAHPPPVRCPVCPAAMISTAIVDAAALCSTSAVKLPAGSWSRPMRRLFSSCIVAKSCSHGRQCSPRRPRQSCNLTLGRSTWRKFYRWHAGYAQRGSTRPQRASTDSSIAKPAPCHQADARLRQTSLRRPRCLQPHHNEAMTSMTMMGSAIDKTFVLHHLRRTLSLAVHGRVSIEENFWASSDLAGFRESYLSAAYRPQYLPTASLLMETGISADHQNDRRAD